jgi:hypothetical protein
MFSSKFSFGFGHIIGPSPLVSSMLTVANSQSVPNFNLLKLSNYFRWLRLVLPPTIALDDGQTFQRDCWKCYIFEGACSFLL